MQETNTAPAIQRKVTIQKAKLTSMNYIEVEFNETLEFGDEKYNNEVSKKCTWDVHNDLKLQLDRLKPHLALLCEQVDEVEIIDKWEDHALMAKIKVTGYVIGGRDEHEGVTLIGRRVLANNRVLNLNSPFTKWEDEHNGYMYAGVLKSIINDLETEVIAYLDGKKAPSVQQSIEFPKEQD
jgi:hypothetical protein